MTIIKTMAAVSISKNYLNVNEDLYHTNGERNRGRSERASSLALPHSSLLDFYDKGQEQCSSVALLPISANIVVRRHSSHCYPTLEDKQLQQQKQRLEQQQQQLQIQLQREQQQQQQHQQLHHQQQQQQHLQNLTIQSLLNSKTLAQQTLPKLNSITKSYQQRNLVQLQQQHQQQQQQQQSTHFNIFNNKANQHHQLIMSQQDMQSTALLPQQATVTAAPLAASATLASKAVIGNVPQSASSNVHTQQLSPSPSPSSSPSPSLSLSSCPLNSTSISGIVNNDEGKCVMMTQNVDRNSSSIGGISMTVPATPPPPIPKRTFRGKYMGWNGSVGSPTASAVQTPIKGQHAQFQQHQQQQQSNTFIYPQANGCGNDGNIGSGFYPIINEGASLYVDIATPSRSLYSDGGLDAGGISDDDHMSLENSVFDESLTSTPVKVASLNTGAKLSNVTFAAKTLAAALNASEISNAAKRSNRSSSSTVDSMATSSSGYGSSSHSERFASTSTTADFRSRFSSVDTQSSLDSCLTEKTHDSPLLKDSFKMERNGLSDATLQDYNNTLNNNELQLTQFNNNNTLERQLQQQKVPAVPQRKQQYPLHSSQIKNSNAAQNINQHVSQQSLNSSKTSSSVSASTSTSSNASAVSATSPISASGSASGSGSLSISANASNTTISPQTHNAKALPQLKRPVPPLPPVRSQNSFDTEAGSKPLAMRNKWHKQKPPPIVYPKLHQRQDSTLSSDSFSVTSSPGYNTKTPIEAPLLQNAARINKSGTGLTIRHQDSNDSFGMTASHYAYTVNNTSNGIPPMSRNKFNYRQDSTISSDSFSQTSSPGYNTKIMEAPLLPSSLSVKRLCGVPAPIVCKQKLQNETIEELEQTVPVSPLTKCVSTPASLQTIVRFQNGAPNTMSLQHRIINRRKSSNPYVTNGRLKFRLFQVLINAFALLAIAGGLAAYFNAYPTIKFVNKTIINTIHVENISSYGKNPAPGTCLPIIVKFCQGPQIPYNYTVFPNYIGHFGQLDTQVDLDAYEALVDVRCYELVSLFLCTLFVPKCGSTGATVPPCKTLCTETMRRCGFFFDVFGLTLPEYLSCKLFKDFQNAEDCVGLDQVQDVMIASTNPKCDGFQCDQNRCLPKDYVCDGHLDCMDQADEASCERCKKNEIYCGDNRCISENHICDGVVDCPYGQDERNCIRLSERNGDLGKGILEIFRIGNRQWSPACVKNWDRAVSPTAVCSMLGYSSVNATSVVTQKTHRTLMTSVNVSTDIWKMYAKKRSNLMKELSNCKPDEDYPIAELTCANYECGKVKRERHKPSRRIIGGSQANPGSWPFLAAILGGPEKIFYCAGVLISDQWVLTASHCIGNHTVIDLEDWTIQLGVTRRNSFTYTGQKVKVKTVIPHPQYNTAIAHDNDIALFQLATRVAFHEHLLPVCLPPPGFKQLKPDQLCTVIGWGKREDKDPKSTYEPIVNQVQVPIIRRQICDEWLDNLTVSDGMICAGYEEGGKDACQGDSGGPLLCPYPGEKDRWFVGGIVSWGIMCAHPKLPGVYANVVKYVPWIQEQIQKYSKPMGDDKMSKYDVHPGGPDILSNMSPPGPLKNKRPTNSFNRHSVNSDYFENMDNT